ncbi:hypothetical protein K445DRAFT_20155 [Daldinia sp. EC12]|nr:hypothetical protein K445DRAFT_20155 [Daldinia sp. EC12]
MANVQRGHSAAPGALLGARVDGGIIIIIIIVITISGSDNRRFTPKVFKFTNCRNVFSRQNEVQDPDIMFYYEATPVSSGFLYDGQHAFGLARSKDVTEAWVNDHTCGWIQHFLKPTPSYFMIILLLWIYHSTYSTEKQVLAKWDSMGSGDETLFIFPPAALRIDKSNISMSEQDLWRRFQDSSHGFRCLPELIMTRSDVFQRSSIN